MFRGNSLQGLQITNILFLEMSIEFFCITATLPIATSRKNLIHNWLVLSVIGNTKKSVKNHVILSKGTRRTCLFFTTIWVSKCFSVQVVFSTLNHFTSITYDITTITGSFDAYLIYFCSLTHFINCLNQDFQDLRIFRMVFLGGFRYGGKVEKIAVIKSQG